MKFNKGTVLRACFMLGACTSFVQFITPIRTPQELQKPVKKSLWDKLTGKGKIKVTLIKGKLEERKEPWSYQVIVENSNLIKPIKTFYKDATIYFDLADGQSQSVKITGGTGAFASGESVKIITKGKLDNAFLFVPNLLIFGTPFLDQDGQVILRPDAYYGIKKELIKELIQAQIDELTGMKSVREKISRGTISLKAGANQVWQALKKD